MSSEAPLDPCRQWLGIDAADLGDHRRVLGIAPEERDPLAVLRAADAKLAALRGVSAGALEFVRAGFVKRVEAARESVLAEIASSTPPAGGRAAAAFRRPPAPSTLPGGRPAVPPMPLPPPVPRPAVPSSPERAVDAAGGPQPIAIRTAVYRRKSPVLGIALVMIGLSMAAGGLAYYVLVLKPQHAQRGDRRLAARGLEREQDAAEADASDRAAEPVPTTSMPVADEGERPPPRARKRRPRTAESEPETAITSRPQPPPAEAAPAMTRPPQADVPEAKQPTEGMASEGGLEETRQLDAALAEVLDLLRTEQHDSAAELLQSADGLVRSEAGRRRLDGWRKLAASHRSFVERRAAALDAVEPGTSYDVAGSKVVIEELDAEQCVYRTSGPAKKVSRGKIPAGIVMAVVEAWSGEDPEGDLAIGAYQLARDVPQVRLAGEWLEKGRAAGADVDALVALLDDPLFVVPTKDD